MLVNEDTDLNARNKAGLTPLHLAANKDHAAAITALVAGGANPNTLNTDGQGYTPLHAAAIGNNGNAIGALVAGGADPDVHVNTIYRNLDIPLPMNVAATATPLHLAAAAGNGDAIAALLDAGADAGRVYTDFWDKFLAQTTGGGTPPVDLINQNNPLYRTPIHRRLRNATGR